MRYIERAIGVLSDLENANVLARLLAHDHIIQDQLVKEPPTSLGYQAFARYHPLARSFLGYVMQSATDVRINPRAYLGKKKSSEGHSLHPWRPIHRIETVAEQVMRKEEEFFDSKFEEVENKLRDRLHTILRADFA